MSWLDTMRERAALAQSFLKVKDSFFKLTDVQSWDDVRSVLKAHPELLTPAVDAYMTFLYQENKKEMTPDIVKRFQLELAMLQRLRERGVDAGIAEWIAEGHGLAFGPSTVLEEMQEALKRPVTIENATAMIQYFEKSLEYISRDLHPTIRAFVLLRLGQAYADTAIGDRAEDVERAIIYLEQGLADVTRDTDPTMWAYSQFFLGQAYQRRVSLPEEMEELGNQNRAIDCFEAALEVFTREQYPEQHKMVLLRLARLRTGYSLPEPHWSEMQEEVLGWYEELVGMTDRTNNPGEWARVQNELGRAYQERLAGPPTQNLQQAILLHQTALEEIAPNTADYAETLANIGDAHASTVWRNEADHRAQAINYYRQALGIFTRSNDWASLYEVHEKLGNLAFEVRDWETAARSYLEALAINRDYYKLAITRETRRLVSDMILSIPAMAAYALAQLGRTAQAVETLEQFRTRWLAQTLDLATADLAHLDANDRNLFEQIRKEIAALQAEERLPEDTPNPRPFVQVASELRQAFQRLDEFQKRVMVQHPILFKELDFAAIQRACPSANPIVYLLTTFHGSLALIVTSEGDPCPVWGSLSLRDATKWIVSYESPGEPIVGDYFKNQVILDSLPDTLETMTKSLGEGLMQPLAHALHTLGVSQVTLIPTGTLSAYPLHATPITAQGNRYFVDDFQVAYAPSAYGLVSARESIQKRANQSSRWVGIGVTELAEVELVSAAEKIPAQEKRLVTNTQATRSQALANLNQATLIHLGCHALSMFFGDPFESEFRLFNNETILLRDLLQPELVNLDALAVIILSACQTALPADFMHFQEEVMGFPTVLLSRGVPVVVGTMWKVTDISTTLLIVHFYECLQSGDSIQQALQNAQVWLRHLTRDQAMDLIEQLAKQCQTRAQQNPSQRERWLQIYWTLKGRQQWLRQNSELPFASPLYWAGFQVVGAADWHIQDGKLVPPEKKQEPTIIQEQRRLLRNVRRAGVWQLQADKYKETHTQTALAQRDRDNQEFFKKLARVNKRWRDRISEWGYTFSEEDRQSLIRVMALVNAGKNPDWTGEPFYFLSEVNTIAKKIFGSVADADPAEANSEEPERPAEHPADVVSQVLDHFIPQFEQLHTFAEKKDLNADDQSRVKQLLKEIRRELWNAFTAKHVWKDLNQASYQNQVTLIEAEAKRLGEQAQAMYETAQIRVRDFAASCTASPDVLRVGSLCVITPSVFRELAYSWLGARFTQMKESGELTDEERRRTMAKKTLEVMEDTMTIGDVYGAVSTLIKDFPEFQIVAELLEPKEKGELMPAFIPLTNGTWCFRVPSTFASRIVAIAETILGQATHLGGLGAWSISQTESPDGKLTDVMAFMNQASASMSSNQQKPVLFVWTGNLTVWDEEEFKDCIYYFFVSPTPADSVSGEANENAQ